MPRLFLFCCTLLLPAFLPTLAWANQCFNFAETYYQQIYCEIKASGGGAKLPRLADFRRNNEQMQALLLKPHARAAGIALVLPQKVQSVAVVDKNLKREERASDLADNCRIDGLQLHCDGAHYHLVNNRANDLLAPDALASTNRMALPAFQGDPRQPAEVERYLLDAYRHYLEKMMQIGLGGSTMAYGKFAYLFEDLARRGMSFPGRFETMYGFLKADKRKLSVPVRTALPPDFNPKYCYPLMDLLLCHAGAANLVFSNN